jgi:hypothetical protein
MGQPKIEKEGGTSGCRTELRGMNSEPRQEALGNVKGSLPQVGFFGWGLGQHSDAFQGRLKKGVRQRGEKDDLTMDLSSKGKPNALGAALFAIRIV